MMIGMVSVADNTVMSRLLIERQDPLCDVYITDEETPQFYQPAHRERSGEDGKVPLRLSPLVGALCEAQLEIFGDRTRCCREVIVPQDEALAYALRRAVRRMNLSAEAKDIVLRLLAGESKKTLMAEGFSLEEMGKYQMSVREQMQYYCFSEREKEQLVPLVWQMFEGRPEPLYTTASYATQHDVPQKVIEDIEKAVLADQAALSGNDTERFRALLAVQDVAAFSDEDKAFFAKATASILAYYVGREKAFYRMLAGKLVEEHQMDFRQMERYCLENRHHYGKLRHACRDMHVRRGRPHRRKKLKDFLD